MNDKMRESIVRGESVFTGSMFGLLGIDLATIFLSVLTFGLAYPWLLCWRESWYAEHTYINGKQLYFDGTGGQWFGRWLLWVLLTIITLGIYGLWVPIKIEQWRVKHTHFVDAYKPAYDTEPIKPKIPPIIEVRESTKFCTNCGAALSGGNAMVDGKHCRHCMPASDDARPKPDYSKPAPVVKKCDSGFTKPDDSDLD